MRQKQVCHPNKKHKNDVNVRECVVSFGELIDNTKCSNSRMHLRFLMCPSSYHHPSRALFQLVHPDTPSNPFGRHARNRSIDKLIGFKAVADQEGLSFPKPRQG